MTENCNDFYERRDQRTEEYLDRPGYAEVEVGIFIGVEASATRSGQIAALALANQLARVHRDLTFCLQSSEKLFAWSPFASNSSLGRALLLTCRQIDPCGDFEADDNLDPREVDISVGIGEAPTGCDWYLGNSGAIGILDTNPHSVRTQHRVGCIGAGVAACLGAAAVFRNSLGMEARPHSVSGWNCREAADADRGPEKLPPVDVGDILVVGAGAVAAAFVYWLQTFGVEGKWTIVDHDAVQLHNTNRGLLFTPADAGWPVGASRSKARLLETHLGANSEAEVKWYEESSARKQRFDLILCLANEGQVRTQIARRNQSVVLHATTSSNWMSQLHRHISGVDDCIQCRTGDVQQLKTACSKGSLDEARQVEQGDAALPFLSAASGLMLCTALQRLQSGELADDNWNDWRWYFLGVDQMVNGGRRSCKQGCDTQSLRRRRNVNEGTKWADLDPSLSSF